jgi:hypothetical protein
MLILAFNMFHQLFHSHISVSSLRTISHIEYRESFVVICTIRLKSGRVYVVEISSAAVSCKVRTRDLIVLCRWRSIFIVCDVTNALLVFLKPLWTRSLTVDSLCDEQRCCRGSPGPSGSIASPPQVIPLESTQTLDRRNCI